MKIFLTGHRGFLGRSLLRAIEANGFESATTDSRLTPENVRQLVPDGLDAIVHLAARTPQSTAATEQADFSTDTIITKHLANACLDDGIRFVFASSSTIYAENNEPLREDDPLDPQSQYAKSKFESENLLNDFQKSGLDCIILRLFNAFGPTQLPSYFIPYVLNQALSEQEIDLKNPGNVRDYVFINDVASAFIKAATFSKEELAKLETSPTFNIGSGSGVSGTILIDMVENILGRKLKVRLPEQPKNYNRYVANCTRARNIFGFNPAVTFSEGLEKTIEHLQSISGTVKP